MYSFELQGHCQFLRFVDLKCRAEQIKGPSSKECPKEGYTMLYIIESELELTV